MRRCPGCQARLSDESRCSRCGADLTRVFACERAGRQSLSLALQMLQAGRPDIAAYAVNRSLSFKQTPEARVFREFLIRHQYEAVYEAVVGRHCHRARQAVAVLDTLQAHRETLQRFLELIDRVAERASADRSQLPSVS